MPAPCGIFLCLAMCLRMYETKLHCPIRITFVWSSFWGRLLFHIWEACWPNVKEKPSLYRGSLQKYITQGCWIFPRYIIRHKARQRKNQGSGAFTGRLQLWAPFEEGFSFVVEKPAGPMRKRSLHCTEAPGKNISPRTLNFPQIHH